MATKMHKVNSLTINAMLKQLFLNQTCVRPAAACAWFLKTVSVQTSACVCLCLCLCACLCGVFACACVCKCVCMCVCLSVCLYIRMCVWLCLSAPEAINNKWCM